MGAHLSDLLPLEPNEENSIGNSPQQSNSTTSKTNPNKEEKSPHNSEENSKQGDFSAEESNSNCLNIPAKSLSITWGNDNRYWHWPTLKGKSGKLVEVAELVNVCWLEVRGTVPMSNLSPGTEYEIVFDVKLKESAYGWHVPVNLRLTLPDGNKQDDTQDLMKRPREKWIKLVAGVVTATGETEEDIEFLLYEYGGMWKRGLCIEGVSIRPKA